MLNFDPKQVGLVSQQKGISNLHLKCGVACMCQRSNGLALTSVYRFKQSTFEPKNPTLKPENKPWTLGSVAGNGAM